MNTYINNSSFVNKNILSLVPMSTMLIVVPLESFTKEFPRSWNLRNISTEFDTWWVAHESMIQELGEISFSNYFEVCMYKVDG